MYRITTPQHTFTLNFSTELIDELLLTYKQDKIVVEKQKSECTLDGSKVIVSLTQEETKKFKNGKVEIQLRIKTTQGKVIASQIIRTNAYEVLSEEVL